MKKTINAGIASRSFIMDEDAYARLDSYLNNFRSRINNGDKKEVMEELESRIAELFLAESSDPNKVIDITLVNKVISQLGMPDGSDEASANTESAQPGVKPSKKLYRDTDDKMLGGVCGGLAAYFNTDVVIIRILFVALLICASAGFWAYLIFWIVAPAAKTPAQKCEMRGLAPTMDNLARFTNSSK